MKNAKENKGITLVALIITVIILLILAGVTISLVIGENGIITRSKETSKKSFEKDVQESLELAIADLEISKTESGEKVEITDLLEKGYINEEGVININKLLGKKGQYGNGANKQDVFIIENNELWYYEKNGEGKKISKLSNLGYLPTDEKYLELYQDGISYIGIANYSQYYICNQGASGKESPLETYVIPHEINGKKIEAVGHFNSPNIKKIIIKNGFEYIGIAAFAGCTSLESVEIPNSVTRIGPEAFAECKSLKSIDIPSSVSDIGEAAFWGCKILEDISLKEGLKGIGTMAFGDCTNLVNLKIPNSVESIGESAFSNCTKLKNINIPEKVTKINRYLFRNCTSLESITIPKNITEIDYAAFIECTNLKSIDIPNNVTNIEGIAFSGCTNLKTINYEGTEEDWETINIKNGNDELKNVKINYNYKYQD